MNLLITYLVKKITHIKQITAKLVDRKQPCKSLAVKAEDIIKKVKKSAKKHYFKSESM